MFGFVFLIITNKKWNDDMIKNEILAPVGSLASLYAAIAAGADAVYTGGSKFGARAYADNFDEDTLKKAIDYVHIQGKKIYLTVNTLLKNNEMEHELYEYLAPLYDYGLDAVIVQDIGVLSFVRKYFPDIDVHCSTQMAVTSRHSAQFLKNLGATRVVTARELSLQEIRDIHEHVDIEIESFVHGAMCYCYSGMCLFSSMVGGRSGNRGRCAGPCRQPYEVFKDQNKVNHNASLYALSLRDMNTLSIIPEIVDCGVYSLKIEGRMKSPEYVAGTVSMYKKYVELYLNQGRDGFAIDSKDAKNLAGLYTRSGSTTGYYMTHNDKKMVSYQKPAYNTLNPDFEKELQEQYANRKVKLTAHAEITAKLGQPLALTVVCGEYAVTSCGNVVSEALKRAVTKEDIRKQINKTGDSDYEFDYINVCMDDNLFIPVSELNTLRRTALGELSENMTKIYRRTNRIAQEKLVNQKLAENKKVEKTEISCQIQNKLQWMEVMKYSEVTRIYISTDELSVTECRELAMKTIQAGKQCFVALPYIYRITNGYTEKLFETLADVEGVNYLIKNIDELALMQEKHITNFAVDSSLYEFNHYAKRFLHENSAAYISLPYELNGKEMIHLADREDEVVVYGNVPLMVTANCLNKNYNQCEAGKNRIIEIKDRKNTSFQAKCCCNHCYNIIYNCVPVSLIGIADKVKKIPCGTYRINFTLENCDSVSRILEKCIKVFYYGNRNLDDIKDYTRGHFNRGVE